MKNPEKVQEINDIKIIQNKEVENRCYCDNCENITRFSDKDDDFIANYDKSYTIKFWYYDITLCKDCLKQLKMKIDKILNEDDVK